MTETKPTRLTPRTTGSAQEDPAPPPALGELPTEAELDWRENQERPAGQTRRINLLLWGAYLLAVAALGAIIVLAWQ